MAHFQLDKQISEATRMDSAIQRGPMMRWQRKALEQGVRSLALDNSQYQGNEHVLNSHSTSVFHSVNKSYVCLITVAIHLFE